MDKEQLHEDLKELNLRLSNLTAFLVNNADAIWEAANGKNNVAKSENEKVKDQFVRWINLNYACESNSRVNQLYMTPGIQERFLTLHHLPLDTEL